MLSENAEQEVQACDALFQKGQQLIRGMRGLEEEYRKRDEENRAAIDQVNRDVQSGLKMLETCQQMFEESRERLEGMGEEMTSLVSQFHEVAQMVVRDRKRVERLEQVMDLLALEPPRPPGKKCVQSEKET